jgi:hypothetical protein
LNPPNGKPPNMVFNVAEGDGRVWRVVALDENELGTEGSRSTATMGGRELARNTRNRPELLQICKSCFGDHHSIFAICKMTLSRCRLLFAICKLLAFARTTA